MTRTLIRTLLIVLLAASPQAFARSNLMSPAADQAPKPQEGKALVVFLRPSAYGGGVSSTVYEAPDDGTTFLGAVESGDKLGVQMEPGDHRLMVIGENADFLDARLEAGKTYYVLVKVRMGAWKARFSLTPIHNDAAAQVNLQGADFKEWNGKTSFVEKSPEADKWFEANQASVEKKKAKYLEKWNRMLPVDRAVLVLHPQDGVAQ